jgi:DNA-binding PadR family transcriptional regulator
MSVSKDLVAASATPLVLAILRRGPSYGYAIIKEVRALSGGALEWTDGMLYPVLHRLERDGLIEAYDAVSETGRARRYYRIRRTGLKELEQRRRDWLTVHAALVAAWEA